MARVGSLPLEVRQHVSSHPRRDAIQGLKLVPQLPGSLFLLPQPHTKCLLTSQLCPSDLQNQQPRKLILTTDTDYSMDEPCKRNAQYKKFVTGHLLCASTYMKCPEQANPKTEYWLSRTWSGG